LTPIFAAPLNLAPPDLAGGDWTTAFKAELLLQAYLVTLNM
jgi:hypothetical protein